MPLTPQQHSKRPAWVRRYRLDFSGYSELKSGETISSITSVTATAGLTVGSTAISGSQVLAWLSSGTAGTTYTVTAVVVTSGGNTLTLVAEVVVEALTGLTFEKRATWARVYAFDFSSFQELKDSETLSSPSVSGSPSGLTIGAPTVSGSTVTVSISSGTAGVDYALVAQVTTSGGATLDMPATLSVI